MKVNVNKIVDDLKSLYAKDKKAKDIICTGDTVKTVYTDEDVVPIVTGHPLRELLGIPGIPFNKIVQCVGKPDCGKSTWAAEMIVSAQKAGIQVVLWDSELKFDAERLVKLGGNPAEVLVVKTNETLQGAEKARKYFNLIKEQNKDAKILFIQDSVGAAQSRSHAERELDDDKHAQPGTDARENSQVMKMLVAMFNKYPDSIAVYLVNQSYTKIGFMQKGEQAAGGTKIEYHSSFIVTLKRIKVLTKVVKGVVTKYGIVTRATVSKNHLSQSETSVHQLDFKVTAKGSEITGDTNEEEESD